MKKNLLVILFLCAFHLHGQENPRIQNIQNNLESLAVDNAGLTENLKLDINVTNVTLPNFLIAVSKVHRVNINVDPSLQGITIVNNFSNVTVADLLVFLCKEYQLDINFTGNILSIKKYVPPPERVVEKEVVANFDALNNRISLDLNNDTLEKVFRKIIDISGQNLLYNSGMEALPLTLYLNNVPFDAAMAKLAETNNLSFSKSRDGFYLFNRTDTPQNSPTDTRQNLPPRPQRSPRGSNFYYQVLDTVNRLLSVDFENVPIAQIINEISYDLKLDVYTATPLEEAGNVTFKAKQIYYDRLLERIFESKANGAIGANPPQNQNTNPAQNRAQSNPARGGLPTNFTYKKEDGIYFFGTADQLSVRRIEVIQMMHRSVELLGDPAPYAGGGRSAGRTIGGNINYLGGGFQNNQGFGNTQGLAGNQGFNNSRRINTQANNTFGNYNNTAEALVNILPDDVLVDLDVKIDFELNSFLVSGPAANINRFRKFIKEIDKPVPVVLIEVMIIEVRKSATVETGISWGIGEEPVKTQGRIFPETDLTLGANTVNKIIGGFDGFGSFNIGQVVPEFFATIKAMEANGNLKIRSTPKLSTLNGHRANLSIGETTYYVVTNQNFFGSQIPTTSEVRNFQPIDAELAVSIKPLVSGNGQVTLDINVIQSDFSGERIEDEAPPGLTSREFSSIIRMQNQDLAILGGLEEKIKNDSGSGVPFLARIPIIKWLFSKRVREDTKQKLTILIKPTVIY
ncbi:type II secretion system protein GspD [Spongiimicrobium sp. 2-473A-2-J]|uniref:type II secretion system protein GspD n=1 Tax=Eudoraea algarum TaxID=3417568 RepID=UPI003D36374C